MTHLTSGSNLKIHCIKYSRICFFWSVSSRIKTGSKLLENDLWKPVFWYFTQWFFRKKIQPHYAMHQKVLRTLFLRSSKHFCAIAKRLNKQHISTFYMILETKTRRVKVHMLLTCQTSNLKVFIMTNLNFKYHTCFEQGIPWHSSNDRVWIYSERRMWHDKNVQSNAPYR